MFSSFHAGSSQIVIVPRKNGCSTGWVGGVGKERTTVSGLHNEKGEARYWSDVLVVVYKPPLWTCQRQTDILLFVLVSTCLCAWQRENGKTEEAHEIFQRPWNTGETPFLPLLIIWALVGGFVGLCWLISSLGTDLLRSDRCWHRLGGLFPELWALAL